MPWAVLCASFNFIPLGPLHQTSISLDAVYYSTRSMLILWVSCSCIRHFEASSRFSGSLDSSTTTF